METTMSIRSKVLVRPSLARRIFTKALWVAVGILVLSAIISFFASGFQLSTLLGAVLPVVILNRFTAMQENASHYEFSLAQIFFGEDEMKIHYEEQKKGCAADVQVLYRQIQKVEYSESFKCFKLTFDTKIRGASDETYHFLYMEPVSNEKFIAEIEKRTGLQTSCAG